MATTNTFSLLLILLTIQLSSSSAADPPISPASLCKFTPDPSYCKSLLPNQTSNVYDSARFSVRKSLSQSRKFLDLVNNYLTRRSSLTVSAIRALEDCKFLAELNFDFLSTSFQTVNTTSQTLSSVKADDIQTLFSAILTNQQTCLDGLQSTASAWSVKNGLSIPLSNDTKLYTVSLALFTKGWVPKSKTWKPRGNNRLPGFRSGRLPLKMSSKTLEVYQSVSRRKLLQADDSGVLVSDIVTVVQNGSGDFVTINDAISAAPNRSNGANGYFMIYVTAGVYEEYVNIPKNKNYLMIVGDGINQTVITGNRNVVDGWTTFNSATFVVTAPNFVAVNITVRNTAGATKHQAVAVRNGADLSTFYSCSFEAYQDTLYTHSLRQFYRECDIYGTVDFIFGNAAVILQNCNIYPRMPMSGQFNAITAQGRTDPNQNTGISIHNCVIRAADDLAAAGSTVKTYLGRPWKEYSRTVYMQNFMDDLIDSAGWQIWSGDFGLNTLYYAEYNNTGPGSDTSNRVTWSGYHVIDAVDAANFTVSNFLLGDAWLPLAGIPFSGSLV
ncbi:probable pectinesterase/pectinesterase inhibitor 20 [Euphorbia lathyris]|uniref:probable pectinesterase/pectinesterase inhibitor 20 n=1 Tax=Euphorbia lathyris TaxID=212925 RepID=UPI0033134541